MKILSIDQALDGKCGFALLEEEKIVFTHLEEYKGIAKGKVRQRCYRFAVVLQQFVKTYDPDCLVTEIVRAYHQGMTNTNTVAALSQLQGVMNVVVPKDKPIYLVNTSSWQAGMIRARRTRGQSKPDMKVLSAELIKTVYRMDVSHHIADAINMGIYVQRVKYELRKNVLEVLEGVS